MMTPTNLCPQGPALSPIVAGAWRLAEWAWSAQDTARWVAQCLELGVSSFDHADLYGQYQAEGLFGAALALHGGQREALQLVSKCGIKLVSPARPAHRVKSYDTSRAHIENSVENSLRALRTDRLDLLLIHRPDALLDASAVAEAFARLRSAGKVLHFGVSNFSPSQFELLDSAVPLSTNQIELHPLHLAPLHDGTLDQAQRLGRRPMIWSPLAGGRLVAAQPNDAQDPALQRVRATLQSLAQRLGTAPATLAYAWLLRHPSRPVAVSGSRHIAALRLAVDALQLRLSAEDWYEIWQAGAGHEVA